MKKLTALFVALCLMLSFALPLAAAEAAETDTRTVVDMSGVEVEIPREVHSYVESWAAHTTVDIMLDGLEGAVATSVPPATKPSWVYIIAQNLQNAKSIEFSDDMNLEEVIALHPDVVFGNVESYREMLANVGIPYVNCTFDSYDTMIQSIQLTADVLGGDAGEIAQRYFDYLSESIERVDERVSSLPEEERLSVVHGYPMYELRVDGSNTIVDEWIRYSGAVNAAGELDGAKKTISLEELLLWDPDVIITGSYADDAESILADPAWANLSAVKSGRLYVNPKGLFMWDRYGIESALQIQWCASTLYPQLFEDLDVRAEVKRFYHDFLNYDPSDEEVEKFMNHQDP